MLSYIAIASCSYYIGHYLTKVDIRKRLNSAVDEALKDYADGTHHPRYLVGVLNGIKLFLRNY